MASVASDKDDSEMDRSTETLLNTIGLKGILLVVFLIFITTVSAIYGIDQALAIIIGASLVLILLLSIIIEPLVFRRKIDWVGVVMLGIAASFTGIKAMSYEAGVWFPVSAASALTMAVFLDSFTVLIDRDKNFIDLLDEVDITGIYGAILLYVYALLMLGGQVSFIYSPFFPALILIFVLIALITSAIYIYGTRTTRAPQQGELHERLLQIIEGLNEVENSRDRIKLAAHVRAVAGALNGVAIPSRLQDRDGQVPIILPTIEPTAVVGSTTPSKIFNQIDSQQFTGYIVDQQRNVSIIRAGSPIKHFLKGTNEFRDGRGAIPAEGFRNKVLFYETSPRFVNSIAKVTPKPGRPERKSEPRQQRQRQTQETSQQPGSQKASIQSDGEDLWEIAKQDTMKSRNNQQPKKKKTSKKQTSNSQPQRKSKRAKRRQKESQDKKQEEDEEGNVLEVGGDTIDIDEILDKANELFEGDEELS